MSFNFKGVALCGGLFQGELNRSRLVACFYGLVLIEGLSSGERGCLFKTEASGSFSILELLFFLLSNKHGFREGGLIS
jgi:hypothetical protein